MHCERERLHEKDEFGVVKSLSIATKGGTSFLRAYEDSLGGADQRRTSEISISQTTTSSRVRAGERFGVRASLGMYERWKMAGGEGE